MAKKIMKVFLVEEFELRHSSTSDYSFYRGAGFCAEIGDILEIQVSENSKNGDTLKTLKRDSFFMVVNGQVVPPCSSSVITQLRMGTKSKVFSRCATFDIDTDTIAKYVSPDIESVNHAKSSPRKRRVSISGIISNVSDVRGSKRKYREMTVMDEEDQVKVMIWGDEALKPLKCDSTITLTGLEVNKDTRGVTLHSSPSTKIERQRFSEEMVIAATNEGFPMELVLESGDVLEVNQDFGIDLSELPCKVRLERAGDGKLLNMVAME